MITVVDVREPEEYSAGNYPESINIPPAELMLGAQKLADLPKDSPIILYCKTGARSNVAINILRQLGYTNLINGINEGHIPKIIEKISN